MSELKPIGPLVFEADFSSATDTSGALIRFTRSERRLLTYLHAHHRQILSRDTLLDAISGEGSEKNDRNIDYLVNRLRRKLRDSAQAPQFILTHYGEGYEWIGDTAAPRAARQSQDAATSAQPSGGQAVTGSDLPHSATGEPATTEPEPMGPVVMGAVAGLEDCAQFAAAGRALLDTLRGELTARFTEPPVDPYGTANLRSRRSIDVPDGTYRLNISFLEIDGRFSIAVLLHRIGQDEDILLGRYTTYSSDPAYPDLHRFARSCAKQAQQKLWERLSEDWSRELSDVPTAVALHRAAEAVGRPEYTWRENETRLRALLERDPDSARAQLLLATALHTKYVVNGIEVLSTSDPRAQDMAEMRTLVRQALPGLHDNPIQTMTAAKILWFCDTDARPEAFAIAARAFDEATAFGSACALMGQMHMWNGDADRGLAYFRKATGFTGPGGPFQIYNLVMICQALAVRGGMRDGEEELIRDLFTRDPRNLVLFSLYYAPPADLDPPEPLGRFIEEMTPVQISALLRNVTFASVRLFNDPTHRRRLLARPYNLIVARHGSTHVPPEVEAVMHESGAGW
ncbi:MAG: winged helix-turn-helix domain-containing protein [Celeribacter sp.]